MADTADGEMRQLLARARKRIETLEALAVAREPVAIVGLACRLPGAADASSFWDNLVGGIDGVGPLRDGRWDVEGLVGRGDAPEPGRMRTPDGGFLNDIRAFDAAFFGVSGREAEYMDPQQRLLLETSWHALEDAGILPSALAGTATGVFVGISSADYGFLQAGGASAREAWAGTGNALSIAANRLSYVFNLNGPSFAVDTACSSSLVAIHQAVRSLRLNESSLAIVAGVNVILNPDISIAFSQAGMLSPSGRCHTFDAGADGYVRSEGVGVVILKRLKDAERDGDPIRAVISGSAVNQDGRGNGLTAPNGLAQQAVIRAAFRDAGVTPQDIAYVEAHGTGTPLGDPIEINNLAKVMEGRDGDPVLVGAVKAAIGHTEAAAGMAGLIKTVLAMEAGALPAQPHLRDLNPRLKDAAERIVTPVRAFTPWPDGRDHAGISAFGFGGTNAHVILKRYGSRAEAPGFDGPDTAILTLSARSEAALRALALNVAGRPPADPCDLAASLQARRTMHAHRLALPVRRDAPEEVAHELSRWAAGSGSKARAGRRMGSRPPRLVFAYSGQGSQKPGMGHALYTSSPIFRDSLERISDAFERREGVSLIDILFAGGEEQLRRTAYAQPAIFALQLALTDTLHHYGIKPDAVMGYSLGEYTAACVAGALPVEDMTTLVTQRGALFQSLPEGGAMLSVRAPAAWVENEIAGRETDLAVAARISDETTVVAGDGEAIRQLRARAEELEYPARPLRVSHAFHSPLLDPILPDLARLCAAAPFQPLDIPLISNRDGQVKKPGNLLEADHWVRHSRDPVEFGRSLQTLAEDPTTVVVEIGPDMTLTVLGRASGTLETERFVTALRGQGKDAEDLQDLLATLVSLGVDLKSDPAVRSTLPGSALPLYPFDRIVHWLEPARASESAVAPASLVQAALAQAMSVPGTADDGDIHHLFAEQLDLVRRTIFSQLSSIEDMEQVVDETTTNSSGPEHPVAASSLPATVRREPVLSQAIDEASLDGEILTASMRPAAELIWLLAQKSDDASRAYHIPVLFELKGPVNPEHIRTAYAMLLARHEALRTVYPAHGEMHVRPVEEVTVDFDVTDGRTWQDDEKKAWVSGLGETVFDLTSDTLIRVRLLRTAEEDWLLSIEAHHLVNDGLSMNILVGELAAIYNALEQGATADLPPAVAYRDWLARHLAGRSGQQADIDRLYWLDRLGSGAPALDLQTNRPRGHSKAWRGNAVLEVMEPDEAETVRSAARSLGFTPFMLLHGLLAVALARYAGQSKIALATPTAGRQADTSTPLVGYCSDLIFSLSTIDDAEPLEDYCRRVRAHLLDDLSHSGYSFAWIAEDLRTAGAELPLQVVFNYQNAYVSAPFDGVSSRVQPRAIRYLDGELTLNAVDIEGRLAFELNYNTALYDEDTARSILNAYTCLLRSVGAGARDRIGVLPLVSRDRLDEIGKGETVPLPDAPPFCLIERMAAERPGAIAVRHGDRALTYGELDARANALAHRLLAADLATEDLVGLHLPRSIDLIVAQLAVSKAGGAFLVLDDRQPVAWRKKIIAQAKVGLVIGREGDLSGTGARFIDPDAEPDALRTAPDIAADTSRLMYVIFTSGSTGEPKGVMIEHGSVANYVGWLGQTLEMTPADRILQFAAIGFDASIEEIYTALTHGSGLTLREEELPPASAFWDDLGRKGITVLDLPTAYWHELMLDEAALSRIPPSLRHVILGGEAAKPGAVARWRSLVPRGIGLWNTYGPTETTIVCTAARLDTLVELDSGPVPIGTPVANAVALVLDPQREPVPPGAIGTLYISGHVLARGYLDRPDLTDAAFVTLPRREGRFYNTGDLVRWRPDGLLEYHGRADDQIKLRGFRVETSGIEKALERLDAISSAAVVPHDANGTTRLAAYIVPASGGELNAEALRAELLRSLPEYLVPQAFVPLPRLPLNANGKIDRWALPAIDWSAALSQAAGTQGAPLDEHERVVADIWAEVLGLDAATLSPDSDFFAVGGDSLLAMRVLTRLGAATRTALSARDLFGAARLGDLAALTAKASDRQDAASTPAVVPITRLSRTQALPLGPSQRRLWFLHQLDPSSGAYNLPSRIEMEGPLDLDRVRAALAALVARHESLRCRFSNHDGEPSAFIVSEADIPLEVVDLSDRPGIEIAVDEAATAISVAPFELDGGPLVRATLFCCGQTRHVLLLCAHHIITDGWSMAILGRDFAAAYAAGPQAGPLCGLQPLDLGYVDYAAAAATARDALDTVPLRDFWRGKLGDLPEILELPTDRPRPETPDGKGRVHRFALSREQTRRLRETAKHIGVTPFAVLFSTWGLLLARLAGQEAFAVGTVAANRSMPGAEEIVGFFAETLALRFEVSDRPAFAALCQRSQRELLDAMDHAALPFEALVEDLVTDRSDSHTPIFQTMFVWQNTPSVVQKADALFMRAERLDKGATQFDLVLDMTEGEDGIEAMLEYRTQLFEPASIDRLAGRFIQLLTGAIDNPDAPVGDIGFRDAAATLVSDAIPDIANRRVDDILDAWADRRGAETAITYEDEDGRVRHVPWAAFRAEADAMAAVLQQHGVGHGDRVAICAERSPELLVAMYAVMMAGAAYVPLDPVTPAERQRALLATSQARLLVTETALLARFKEEDGHLGLAHLLLDEPLPAATATVRRSADPAAPIYIIFTSGTTGTPKGVVVPHRGVANMALGMGRVLGVGPGDSLLQFAPLNFDASALQIFLPLLSGGCAVLHHRPDRLGARDFMDLAERHTLTMLDLPAALWRQWVDTMTEDGLKMAPSIRIFLTGGEALSARTMRRWADLCDSKVTFLSSYGPTEASITATAYVSDSEALATIDDSVPTIGLPLPNVAVHVLDLFGAPAAPGVIGEIAIGGPGVAVGYLDSPERTSASFSQRPDLGRVYLTGDYGRLTEDGVFEFHGRRDAQIKIRGFRIEPAEIESAMLAHPAVADALVVTQKAADRRTHLVAYAVLKQGGGAAADETDKTLAGDLRTHLEALLPEQMVPAAILFLPVFPLLANGKINRRGLPPVTIAEANARPYEAPREGPESVLAAVWKEMLKVESVGRNDNFFELGGDSILSLQLAARARRAGLQFEVRDVFRRQTLAALAAAARITGPFLADQGPISGEIVLPARSAALLARDGLIADRLDLTPPAGLSTERLRAAVETLALHHDGLRASFGTEGAPALAIGDKVSPEIWLEADARSVAALIEEVGAAVLSTAPHFRAVFCEGVPGHLVFLAHPALVDPSSWQILAADFVRLVSGSESLPAKTRPVLSLTDAQDTAVVDQTPTPERSRAAYSLPPDIAGALSGPALAAWRTTPGELALAALTRVLARMDGANSADIDVLLPARPLDLQVDFSRTVWRFAEQGRVSIDLPEDAGLSDILITVKDRIRLDADPSAPSSDVLFVDLPVFEVADGWKVGPLRTSSPTRHPLVVSLDLAAHALVIEHDETSWPETDVADLAAATLANLRGIVAVCITPGAGGLTRSDVPLARISQADLERICAEAPDVETLYDASFGQAGMLFHSLLSPASGAFLIQTRVDFSPALDVDALKAAIDDLVVRHPVLRTSFRWEDRAQPLQVVHATADVPFEEVDLSRAVDESAELEAVIARDLARPLDLLQPPLMRLTLVRTRAGWTLVWLKHHAVVDGWSMPLLYDDLLAFYAIRASGRQPDVSAAPGFDRYIGWLRNWNRSAAEAHWARELAGFDVPTELGIGRGAAAETGLIGRASQQIEPVDFQRLTAMARDERVTLGTLVIGAFLVLLSRYAGTSETLTNVTVSGRPHDLPEAENIAGMFLNTVPLRADVDDAQPIWSWLRTLQDRQATNDAMGHLGLLDMQRLSEVPAGQRLSETLVIVQNTPLGAAMSAGLGTEAAGLPRLVTAVEGLQKTGAPITVFAEGRDQDLTLTIQYDAGRFDPADMTAFAGRFTRILREMTERKTLGDLRLLDAAEEAAVIARSAGPFAPAPDASSLIAVFERQVRLTPDRIALFDREHRLTYAELDERARRIGLSLMAAGVQPGEVVGLLSERSLDATAALLGIMKAGAAFLALDPSYPIARLHHMLEDSGAQLLLHAVDLDPSLTTRPLSLAAAVAVDHPRNGLETLPGAAGLTPESLAYLIYTSGSTGRPKGVRALHRGALNRFDWMWREMPFEDGEVMVQKTALSFVDSVWEIFGPLLAGVPSLVLDEASVRDVPGFLGILAEHRVSRLVLVPTLLRAMLEIAPDLDARLPALMHWISSGEALPGDLVRAFRRAAPGRRLINLYGSSEVAGDVTWFDTDEMPENAILPASLGRPMDNCAVYLLDAGRRPVPDGMPGELWIGGANLADRYHGLPEQSADAFVANPFGEGMLFRSRDWGRRETDGTITFLGRQDGQVKIRGMRVDLGEVEAVIREVEAIQSAVVLNRPGADGRPRIAAWYIGTLTPAELRDALSDRLPRHMVPAALIALESIPLLPNGKVDRRALPDPDEGSLAAAGAFVPLQTATEARIAALWAGVLGIPPAEIGRTHNYFHLGGDSISAIRVATRAAAGGLALGVRDIFETTTLADLAARVDSSSVQAAEPIDLGPGFPDIAPDHWRHFVLALDAPVNLDTVQGAMDALVARHDLLGGRIETRLESAVLIVGPKGSEEGAAVFIAAYETTPDGPAIRLSGHPLLIDAAAWMVIVSDVRRLLSGRPLPQPAPSVTLWPPRVRENPGPVVMAGPRWSIPATPALFSLASEKLHARADELVAAAAMRAFAGTHHGGPIAIVVADRPVGKDGIVSGRERIVHLPRSSGYPAADLRAAKRALRRRMDIALAEAPGLTIRFIGGDPAFFGVKAESPVLMLGLGSAAHLELLPADGALSVRLYEADADRVPAFNDMMAAFGDALEDYGRFTGRSEASVWIASDFPLATIKPNALSTLAARYPDVETVQAVTPGQTGMIFHSLADPESAVYGLHTTLKLRSGVDLQALEAAFAALIARHGILRTSFDWTLGEHPLQIVLKTAGVPITLLDWRNLSAEEHETALAERINADRALPIDLAKAPAMRATVVLGPDGGADLLWAVHHAAVDGWSLPILLRDLAALYDGILGLPAAELPDPPNFAAYLRWIARQDRIAGAIHWKTAIGDLSSGTDLVIGRGIAAETGVFESRKLRLSGATFAPLLRRARAEGVTVSTLVQGAWAALLARYNQAEEQVFGVTVSGRPAELPGIEDAVGTFVNVLPLRLATRDDAELWDWLRAVQRTHSDNDRHNYFSFADIQALSALPAGERLCDSMLVVQNFPMDIRLLDRAGDATEAGQGLVDLIQAIDGHQTTSYALTIFALPQGEELDIEFVYDAGRFDQAGMEALATHLTRVFESMAAAETFGQIGLLNEEEEAARLASGRGVDAPQPEAASILAVFEAQADATPDAPAILYGEQIMTYAEIEAGANVLAAEIAGWRLGRNAIVAVHLQRSPQMVIALLAIMKAGAAWLPLDPAYPADRLTYMLEDSRASLLVRDDLDFTFDTVVPTLDVHAVLASGRPAPRPFSRLTPDDLAYLIYTSGSTGRPKGVKALHRGLLARVSWSARALPYRPDDVAVIKTALPFVDSVAEIFGPLAHGVPAVVVPAEDVADVRRFIDILEKHAVTWIVLVPSLLRAILDMQDEALPKLRALRTWIVSGEACTAELVAAFRGLFPDARLVNFYGSSEVAGDVTWFDTTGMAVDDPAAPVPIGRPIDGNHAFILDRRRRPMPISMPGELYIAGDHLADGYHGQPAMTAEAFLANPFGTGRMFRTKDWARWDQHGLIEFLGRQDGQIKIRGMRVEIGEVEAVLRSQPGVEDAVVQPLRAPDGGLALAAYWSGLATASELREGVGRRLAAYMTPQHWVNLAALPLLPNGKIDRRSLPDPLQTPRKAAGNHDVRPAGLIEELLLPGWAAALGQPEADLSATDDFFALGGHSLAAARALAEIFKRTGITLRLRHFYEASSLRDVAARIEAELLAGTPPDELEVLIAEAQRDIVREKQA